MSRPEPRPQIVAMSNYHSPQVDVPVRLNTNESPFAPPQEWTEELGRIADTLEWNRYPDRSAHILRGRIAERHAVDPANVIVGNGSNEIIQMLLLAYGGHGRKVAVFEPTYQMYTQIARVTGAEVVKGERRADFTLDPMEIVRLTERERPSVTFLCNPNNPTGTVEPRSNLETLLGAPAGLVVVDEAYAEFSDWSAVDMVTDEGSLVVTRTFSKTLSMAALRVGYAVAPRDVIQAMEVASLPYHLDAFKQAATVAALGHTGAMEDNVAFVRTEREWISRSLAEVGCEVWPSGANFVLFRPPGRRSAEIWAGLLERGVLVRDCSSWPGLEGCLRVTVGHGAENGLFVSVLSELVAETR
ncbi:MAG: histidinol-phosphate transaminase [Acidimicrobiales bacterium]